MVQLGPLLWVLQGHIKALAGLHSLMERGWSSKLTWLLAALSSSDCTSLFSCWLSTREHSKLLEATWSSWLPHGPLTGPLRAWMLTPSRSTWFPAEESLSFPEERSSPYFRVISWLSQIHPGNSPFWVVQD